jgi:hypothetical protein
MSGSKIRFRDGLSASSNFRQRQPKSDQQRERIHCRVFRSLVLISHDDPAHDANTAAWDALSAYDRPFLCAFTDGDPIARGGGSKLIGGVPAAAGQSHTTIEGAGHSCRRTKASS